MVATGSFSLEAAILIVKILKVWRQRVKLLKFHVQIVVQNFFGNSLAVVLFGAARAIQIASLSQSLNLRLSSVLKQIVRAF